MRKPSCMTNTLSAPGSSRLNYPDAQACPKLLLKNTYSLLSISPQSSGFRCLALAVRLSFWLETTETTLPCPLIPTVTPGPLSSPEICWTNSWGISKNSCTAHLSGGGGGQRAVSSSEFRPDPHPSLPLPSQKKSYNTRPLFPNSLFWSPTPFKSNTQPKLRAAGHYTVERRISPGHHGRRIPLLITPNNSVLSWI